MPGQINTLLMDFRLASPPPTDDELRRLVLKPLADVTKIQFGDEVASASSASARTLLAEAAPGQPAAVVLVRVYEPKQARSEEEEKKVLVTVTVEMPARSTKDSAAEFSFLDLELALKTSLRDAVDKAEVNDYPCIRRCLPHSPYLRSTDNRLQEYGYSEVLFSRQSEYQHVQIVDTVDFGRVLLLDNDVNLGESDTEAYTHTLLNWPNENYKDKTVLILGGGDGGLLKELLGLPDDQQPAFVTMVDIDDMVMTACSKYMRSVCGDYLDEGKREGPRHKIITGDALKFMDDCLHSGQHFDYVLGDLTQTPMSTEGHDADLWAFLRSVLERGLGVCRAETGRYLTHCNGKNVPEAQRAYEDVLRMLAGGKCTFKRTERFVPSFMETWLFYQITRHE